MKVSYNWLKTYFADEAPAASDIQRLLNFHSFEVESVEQIAGDMVYDVKVLPNRAHDCLSHVGIAKELSAITSLPLRTPLFDTEISDFAAEKTVDYISLTVQDATAAPRAMKRMMFAVQIGPSPAWLVDRLASIGQRSINNVVDATNFLTHELGQPVHAFDYDKLAGTGRKDISIRFANDGETVTTLDGRVHKLDPSMLVIADGTTALDIAGIKGGIHSGIDESTKRIMLSACNFRASMIRKTSQKLGLRTDASVRFEHEISPEMALRGMERLTALILELAGGKPSTDLIDLYPRRANPFVCGVSVGTLNSVLGTNLSRETVQAVLGRLGLSFVVRTPVAYALDLAPTLLGVPYKLGSSITYEAPTLFDCSAFTSYLFAQGGIAIPRMAIDQYFFGTSIGESELMPGDLIFSRTPWATPVTTSVDFLPGSLFPEGLSHVGLYMGEGEVIHAASPKYKGAVVFEKYKDSPAFADIAGFRRIAGADQERIAVTIPPERLDLRHEYDLIEEIGRIHGYEHVQAQTPEVSGGIPEVHKKYYYAELIRSRLIEKGFSEITSYSFSEAGDIRLANPINENEPFLRTALSPKLEERLAFNKRYADLLALPQVRLFEIGNIFSVDGERTHIALASSVKEDLRTLLGYDGDDLYTGSANLLEFDLDALVEPLPEQTTYADLPRTHIHGEARYGQFSPYPFVSRDIAVFTPDGTAAEAVQAIIVDNAGEYFLHTRLFDQFQKKGSDGIIQTSYAYRIVFQSKERTLTSEEIDLVLKKIVDKMNVQTDWKVR